MEITTAEEIIALNKINKIKKIASLEKKNRYFGYIALFITLAFPVTFSYWFVQSNEVNINTKLIKFFPTQRELKGLEVRR